MSQVHFSSIFSDLLLQTMVKVGAYTVELVAADTKKPFKEHTASDGQVYAEVEPDMDYYIALNSDVKDVMMSMYVDGVDLGYDQTFECLDPSSMYQGKWETTKDGKETMTALHFNKTRQEAGTQQSTMLTGKVEVKIYSLGEMYYSKPRDFVSTSLTADSTLGGKKCIKTTTSGSHSFDDTPMGQTASTETVEFDYGEHLQTITLNYCSAFGLIYHKILPPPPDLLDSDDGDSVPVKKERSTMKRKSTNETTTPFSTARRVSPRRKTTFQNDNEVQIMTAQTKTYDIVDLTGDE